MGLSLDEWICAGIKCPAWRQRAGQDGLQEVLSFSPTHSDTMDEVEEGCRWGVAAWAHGHVVTMVS